MALPTGAAAAGRCRIPPAGRAARVLRVNPSQVGRNEPLQNFGLDSISAGAAQSLGGGVRRDPRATLIWDHPTISALAAHLAVKLETPLEGPECVEAVQPPGEAERAAVVAQIKTLSEDEAEKLLLQKLSSIETKRSQ
jgi:hypothetical protein